MSPKGPPLSFLLFCYRMRVYKSKRVPLLHFSALCDIFRKNFFSQKFQVFFPKEMFCAFWALDIAPTWDVPDLFSHTRLPMFFSDQKFEGVNLDGRWYLKYDLMRNYSWWSVLYFIPLTFSSKCVFEKIILGNLFFTYEIAGVYIHSMTNVLFSTTKL